MENHRWTLRVRTTDAGTARVIARKHQFEVGPPIEFDEDGPRVTALEYFLGALGSDLAVGLAQLARRRSVRLEHVEAVVEGELNDPLSALGVVGAKGHPGIERVRVKIYVSSLASEPDLNRLWEEVQATSPLLRTFRSAFTIELSLQVAL